MEIYELKNKLLSLKKQLVLKKNISQKDNIQRKVIKGYQASYEYISDNNLKPMFEETQTSNNGTLYDIYVNETKVTNNENSMVPPTMPIVSSTDINGEIINVIVSSGSVKITV